MGRVVEAQPCKHFMTATACMPVDAAAHSLPVALALPQMYACIYILQAFLLALSQHVSRRMGSNCGMAVLAAVAGGSRCRHSTPLAVYTWWLQLHALLTMEHLGRHGEQSQLLLP